MRYHANQLYEFGPFRLDATERLLLREGHPVPLTNKAFDTLLVLVENRGHIVEKDDMMQKVWPDTFIEESTLAQNVFRLRRALGEDSSDQQYIETVPKHGYRFVAAVRELRSDPAALILEKHTRSRIITEEEERISALPEVERVVRQALSRASGLRLITTLLVPFLLLTGVAAALIYFSKTKPKEIESPTAAKVIAVLPFKPIGAEGRDEYLELGMADALITKLSSINQVVVRSTNSVRKYTALEQDPITAGRELRVDSVLEGSIQRLEDRLRVTARLVRVQDGASLWVYECDQQCTDVFAVQDSISEQMAKALALKLTREEKKLLTKRYTENAGAYQLYERGRYFWNRRTEDGLKKAIEYFQQAIDQDPNYALAYAGLADSYNVLGSLGLITPKEEYTKVEAAAKTALEIDDALAEAHNSLAWVRFDQWDWSGAEIEFRRAIELSPNYATAHQWYAEYLTAMARFDEAIAEIKRAQQLEPASLIINTIVAQTYLNARQYDQAIEQCHKTLELDSNFELAYIYLGLVYMQKGMYEEALAQFKKVKQLGPPAMLQFTGLTYAMSGNREAAKRALHELLAMSKQRYISSYSIATLYANLGNRDEAFKLLEKEFNERSGSLIFLKVDSQLDNLRPDPRFRDLLRRVGLSS